MDIRRNFTLADVRRIMAKDPLPGDIASRYHSNGNAWAGGSYEDAKYGVANGDLKASFEADRIASKEFPWTNTVSHGIGTDYVLDTSGDAVDVSRFLSGDPECFYCRAEADAAPIVKIGIGVQASFFQDPERLRTRAMKLFGFIRALQMRGYSIELVVYEAVREAWANGATWVGAIQVMKAGDNLDPAIAAFLCTSPMTLRRVFFALNEDEDSNVRRRMGFGPENGGYGTPWDSYDGKELGIDINLSGVGTNAGAEDLFALARKAGIELAA